MLESGAFRASLLQLPQPVTTLVVRIADAGLALELDHPVEVGPQLFRVGERPVDGFESLCLYLLGPEVLSHPARLWAVGGPVGAAVVVAAVFRTADRHAGEGAPATAATEYAARKLPGSLCGLRSRPVVLHGFSCGLHELAGYAGVGHWDADPLILRDPYALLTLPVAAGTVRRGLGDLFVGVALPTEPPNAVTPLCVELIGYV
jgi:hypothetical protein